MRAKRMVQLASLIAAPLSAVLVVATPAAAAPKPPRLTGTFQVSGTVVDSQNAIQQAGDVLPARPWTFTPACDTGGCTTSLDRTRVSDSTVANYPGLEPTRVNNKWHYTGTSATYLSNCYAADGSGLVLADAYETTETVDLRVQKAPPNVVKSFAGTFRIDFAPTEEALDAGCNTAYLIATVQSVSGPA